MMTLLQPHFFTIVSPTLYETAVADWVSSDYDGVATTWADRRGGKTFAMNGTNPPTWNPLLQCFDFDGVDDFCDTADHADLNFADLQDFTVAVVLESLTPGQLSKTILSKKQTNVNTTAGWNLRTSATGNFEFLASDGAGLSQPASNNLPMPTVAATVGFRLASDSGKSFVETTEGTASSHAAIGTLLNTRALRIGAVSAPTPSAWGKFRIFRVTIWRSAI